MNGDHTPGSATAQGRHNLIVHGHAIWQETFEEENHESFLHEIWWYGVLWCSKSEQSVKVFSLKSFQLYGTWISTHVP